ncbi:S9 family peptidase [soil metagenome]
MKNTFFTILAILLMTHDIYSQVAYQKPPQAVLDVLNAPQAPGVSLNPTKDTLMLIQSERYPSIAEMAQPMLKLAGHRINPLNNAPHRSGRVTGLTLLAVDGGQPRPFELPPGKVTAPEWSPDGRSFVISQTLADRVNLWVGSVTAAKIVKLEGVRLNTAFGDPVQWMPDSKSLLVEMVPENRGAAPKSPEAPPGPTVQETSGRAAPVRTYQDLLQNQHDEDLFEYYATSQLALVNIETRAVMPLGTPAIFAAASPSPDGKLILISLMHKPYSYLHPMSAFPRTVEVWDLTGKLVATIAEQPLQDKIPIEGVPTGRRGIHWKPTDDATLIWTEALDGGDPKAKVPHRDRVCSLKTPFEAMPKSLFMTEHRYSGMSHFPDGDRVLVSDYDRDRRWTRTTLRSLTKPGSTVVFDRSIQDRYNDPGTPLGKRLPSGRVALWVDGDSIYLSGAGATPKGDRPFLDKLDLTTGEKKRLFQCGEGVYETASLLGDDGKLLVRRESANEPGNYYLRTGDKETSITTFKDPTPQIRGIKKQLVTTKRPDGVTISFTLYLPPDYKEGQKYPTVFWAYPREFNSADTAGQVSGSTNHFTTLGGYSHLFFLLNGYVVMDEVSVPIVGPPDKANDTFVEQLTTSAAAAIDKAVEMGPVDRNRIGVGGHSYGAFMTANLLAHSDLFKAGIARSGAYNRTLTPFGFQNERRTFWEAPEVYAKMSPFHNATKINEPLLLIHGAADDNPGTFPVQSERLYQALRGNGATARLVMLPNEAHGYAAKETIEHVLAEQMQWFDKHVKNAK